MATLDWSKEGMAATLWAALKDNFEIVNLFSARNKGNMPNWPACDGEGATAAAAV